MFRIFLALALLLTSGIAWAQQGPKQAKPQEPTTSGLFEGTPEEQAACNRDVQRHCRKVIDQGDFTILACLQQNRPQLSAACNQVLKNHGQ